MKEQTYTVTLDYTNDYIGHAFGAPLSTRTYTIALTSGFSTVAMIQVRTKRVDWSCHIDDIAKALNIISPGIMQYREDAIAEYEQNSDDYAPDPLADDDDGSAGDAWWCRFEESYAPIADEFYCERGAMHAYLQAEGYQLAHGENKCGVSAKKVLELADEWPDGGVIVAPVAS